MTAPNETVLTIPPWAGQICQLEDGAIGEGQEEDRPAEVVAAEIARTAPVPDEGDGSAPSDPEETCTGS